MLLSVSPWHKFEVSCKFDKNRSKNLAPIQINIKPDLKNQKQWDNLMGKFTGKMNTEMRSEWTNDVCLRSVFWRWTFDRTSKTFIFTQHKYEKKKLILKCPTYLRCYLSTLELPVLVFFVALPFANTRENGPFFIFTFLKTDVFNFDKWTCIRWQILCHFFHHLNTEPVVISDICTTNSTK